MATLSLTWTVSTGTARAEVEPAAHRWSFHRATAEVRTRLHQQPAATEKDRALVAGHHGNALLHRVGPRHGLTDAGYLTIDTWLRTR